MDGREAGHDGGDEADRGLEGLAGLGHLALPHGKFPARELLPLPEEPEERDVSKDRLEVEHPGKKHTQTSVRGGGHIVRGGSDVKYNGVKVRS